MKEVKLVPKKEPAKFWKRTLAYALDLLLINLVIVWPFKPYLEKYSNYALILSHIDDRSVAVITGIIILLSFTYFTILEFKIRQTFGKIILNLYVDSTKDDLTLGKSALRNFTKPFPAVLAVDTLYMFFSRTNQRLFEKFSNTHVVEVTWTVK